MSARKIVLSGLFAGCQPAPAPPTAEPGRQPVLPEIPIRHQTQYATVAFSGDDRPICGGTLKSIDSHIERMADVLDVEPEPIEVYWYERAGINGDGCAACYFAPFAIAADYETLFHELNHALSVPLFGRSDKIFLEGLAYGFTEEPNLLKFEKSPSALIGKNEFSSPRFSRWLIATYGPAPFRALFGTLQPSTEEILEQIEEGYGVTLEELEAEFFATAPGWYGPLGTCDDLERIPWAKESKTFRYETVGDCSSSAAFGHSGNEDAPFFMAFVVELAPELVGEEYLAPEVLPDSTGNLGFLTPCDVGEGPPGVGADRPDITNGAVSPYLLGVLQTTAYRVELPFLEDGEPVAVTIEIQEP